MAKYLDDYSLIEWCQSNKQSVRICRSNTILNNRINKYLKHQYHNKSHPESAIDLDKYKKVEL